MDNHDKQIQPGRPRIEVNYELILRLREVEHLGWSRGAEEYRNRTGQWISRDTFKRRYYEAKSMKPLLTDVQKNEILQVINERCRRQQINQNI